jgi:ATPase family associated with various cellular activities (AAA)
MDPSSLLLSLVTTMLASGGAGGARGLGGGAGGIAAALAVVALSLVLQHLGAIAEAARALAGRLLRPRAQFAVKAHVTFRYNALRSAAFPVTFLALCQKLRRAVEAGAARGLVYDVREYPRECWGPSPRDEAVTFINLHGAAVPLAAAAAGAGAGAGAEAGGVLVRTRVGATSGGDKGEYECVVLEVQLEAPRRDYRAIERFVSAVREEYSRELRYGVKEQHVFVFDRLDKDTRHPAYHEFPFATTKSFANMFFDDKDAVLARVDRFTRGEAEYQRLGLPHTLGLLLHGEAGTGKTSFVKSLARHTGRHVFILPTDRVRNIDTLKRVFLDEDVNGVRIPNSRRLYVFEDVDCGCWADVVLARRGPDEAAGGCGGGGGQASKHQQQRLVVEAMRSLAAAAAAASQGSAGAGGGGLLPDDGQAGAGGADDHHSGAQRDAVMLTLGELLELLDGVVEIPGRMLVMTTNRPEVLDPALTRPGRIDLVLHFGRMSRRSVQDMYRLWFGEDLDPDVARRMMPAGRAFTQAQLGSLFAGGDRGAIHAELLRGEAAAAPADHDRAGEPPRQETTKPNE